jgi:hypothetical protein
MFMATQRCGTAHSAASNHGLALELAGAVTLSAPRRLGVRRSNRCPLGGPARSAGIEAARESATSCESLSSSQSKTRRAACKSFLTRDSSRVTSPRWANRFRCTKRSSTPLYSGLSSSRRETPATALSALSKSDAATIDQSRGFSSTRSSTGRCSGAARITSVSLIFTSAAMAASIRPRCGLG